MSRKRRMVFFLTVLIYMLALASTANASFKINRKKVTLTEQSAAIIKLTGEIARKGQADINWESSDEKVCRILYTGNNNAALLYGVKKGKAQISATFGGETRKCIVTVKKYEKHPSKLTIYCGKAYKLTLPKKAKWLSSSRFLSVSGKSGKSVYIKAKKAGRYTVTARYGDETYKCVVTVTPRKWKVS